MKTFRPLARLFTLLALGLLALSPLTAAPAPVAVAAQTPAPGAPETQVISIRYAGTQAIVDALAGHLNHGLIGDESIITDQRTNSLIITAHPAAMKECRELIDRLDQPPGYPDSLNLDIVHGAIMDQGKAVDTATMGNLLEFIRKKAAGMNMAISPDVTNTPIGDMTLHNVDMGALANAIVIATDRQVEFSSGGTSVYSFYSVNSQKNGTAVFNLSNYINPHGLEYVPPIGPGGEVSKKDLAGKVNSVTDLIKTTVDEVDSTGRLGKSLSFRFHDGTCVLVVIGQKQALDIAHQVVNALLAPQIGTPMPFRLADADPQGAPAAYNNLKAMQKQMQSMVEALTKTATDPEIKKRMEAQLEDLIKTYQDLARRYQGANPFATPGSSFNIFGPDDNADPFTDPLSQPPSSPRRQPAPAPGSP